MIYAIDNFLMTHYNDCVKSIGEFYFDCETAVLSRLRVRVYFCNSNY